MAYIDGFYRTYHSMRYVDGRMVVRLTHDIDDAALATLNEEFPDILAGGTIERCEPFPAEIDDPQTTQALLQARASVLHQRAQLQQMMANAALSKVTNERWQGLVKLYEAMLESKPHFEYEEPLTTLVSGLDLQ